MNYVQLLQISCCKSQLFLAILNLIKPSANDSFIFQLPISFKKAACQIKSFSLVDVFMSRLWKFHSHNYRIDRLSNLASDWVWEMDSLNWLFLLLEQCHSDFAVSQGLYYRYLLYPVSAGFLHNSVCTVETKKNHFKWNIKWNTVFKQNVRINVFSRKAIVIFPVGMPH